MAENRLSSRESKKTFAHVPNGKRSGDEDEGALFTFINLAYCRPSETRCSFSIVFQHGTRP